MTLLDTVLHRYSPGVPDAAERAADAVPIAETDALSEQDGRQIGRAKTVAGALTVGVLGVLTLRALRGRRAAAAPDGGADQ